MNVNVIGVIEKELGRRNGVSRDGKRWESREYLIYSPALNRRMRFGVFMMDGEKMENLNVGEQVKVNAMIDCREYRGKWYNKIEAMSIERVD